MQLIVVRTKPELFSCSANSDSQRTFNSLRYLCRLSQPAARLLNPPLCDRSATPQFWRPIEGFEGLVKAGTSLSTTLLQPADPSSQASFRSVSIPPRQRSFYADPHKYAPERTDSAISRTVNQRSRLSIRPSFVRAIAKVQQETSATQSKRPAPFSPTPFRPHVVFALAMAQSIRLNGLSRRCSSSSS
jgi:hypothetical protein